MARKVKKRRQSHGSAWHWQQTDSWYCTQPGTKKRVPLFDENGERIRGKENREAAAIALAREKLAWNADEPDVFVGGDWNVAHVCSEYLQYCQQGVERGEISKGHLANSSAWLNGLCGYCGALSVSNLKKGHVQTWIESHKTWKSPKTIGGVVTVILAAFNRAEELYCVKNPLVGLKKPKAEPRLNSIPPEDEQRLQEAAEPAFANFLFALIHTGLRPFSELARLTADDVEETERGMMWRVYATKTKKVRKIPVRPEVAKLTRELIKSAPRGSGVPIFRNTHGRPWKRENGVGRFIAVKKKLKWDSDPVKSKFSCYACRHTFAHRMLSGYWNGGVGCTIETLAELLGDTPKVAFDHYGREWGRHYQEPLWLAIGEHEKRQPSQSKKSPVRKKSSGSKGKKSA